MSWEGNWSKVSKHLGIHAFLRTACWLKVVKLAACRNSVDMIGCPLGDMPHVVWLTITRLVGASVSLKMTMINLILNSKYLQFVIKEMEMSRGLITNSISPHKNAHSPPPQEAFSFSVHTSLIHSPPISVANELKPFNFKASQSLWPWDLKPQVSTKWTIFTTGLFSDQMSLHGVLSCNFRREILE